MTIYVLGQKRSQTSDITGHPCGKANATCTESVSVIGMGRLPGLESSKKTLQEGWVLVQELSFMSFDSVFLAVKWTQ